MKKLHGLNIGFFIAYILGITALMVWQGIGITPDRYTFVLVLPILFIHKTRKFLMDWTPFVFILISYDFFRGIAGNINPNVHFLEPAALEKNIFGQLPTITLQNIFYTQGKIHWYDFLAAILYFLHFALPLAFAFILWLKNRNYFKQFVASLILLSYAAFATYVIYPAAPPWFSEKSGYISGVTKILDNTLQYFPQKLDLPTIYHSLNPNLVAAIPSLHAAYPLLVFLYALKFFKNKAFYFLPYVLTVWVSIIYLGEHYAIDIIIGAIYAIIFYFAPGFLLKFYHRLVKKFHPSPKVALESS